MTGSSSTSGRHPNILKQERCREKGISDKLWRMAIKNSYESRSLCGGAGAEIQQEHSSLIDNVSKAPNGKLLPSLVNKQLCTHRYSLSSRSKRPAPKLATSPKALSAAAAVRTGSSGSGKVTSSSVPSSVHDVGASAGEDPKVDDDKRQRLRTTLSHTPNGSTSLAIPPHLILRRSTSHSSVSVHGANSSLSQPSNEQSSYIYHIPNRIITRGRSRSQSRVHAHMHTHNIPTLALKRSSSHSTVALNRTTPHHHHQHHHYPSCPSALLSSPHHTGTQTTPLTSCTTVPPAAESPQHSHHRHHAHQHRHRQGNSGGGLLVSLSQDQSGGFSTTQVPTARRHSNKVHDAWAPDIGLIESHFPRVFKHIEHTNNPSAQRRRRPINVETSSSSSGGGAASLPDVHYGVASSHRHKYHTAHPESLAEYERTPLPPTTRLGRSQVFPSSASVAPRPPASAHPHLSPTHSRSAQQESPRRKRVTLHRPRGNKVASLV